eukprot:CAMPEP_0119105448 /NCGR_PEP_ID=MMETSP1180-20130426/3398_1 /TAXON_ID=3052 ORGANISM="Chlamydomonas cf sp, Strain CCMP681" /NCGR_SAMPLE_ID=MMETSP1180 /ASSEMBLY_ACC=CAM_ASM_000741 /LENGTH=91 /DNA_ID=CAMNT_0007090491 /DNA_START=1330 /DNA_END=1605 /DNA_ORIENTATION=+
MGGLESCQGGSHRARARAGAGAESRAGSRADAREAGGLGAATGVPVTIGRGDLQPHLVVAGGLLQHGLRVREHLAEPLQLGDHHHGVEAWL